MKLFSRAALVLAALVLASPAAAHHRQTDPITALTLSGNTLLPRVPSAGRKSIALAVEFGSGRRIVSISPWRSGRSPALQTIIAESGNHADPAIAVSGRAFAFDSGSDPAGSGFPGRQVVGAQKSNLFAVSNDPNGQSFNATIDGAGRNVAFDSTADLAGTGNPGARQVFVRDRSGNFKQISKGVGTSQHAVLSAKRGLIAFESSSEPTTGADTGIAQIWVGDVLSGSASPITAGFGPSRNPSISNDARFVSFESTADLAGTQADTGVSQIFVYDTRTKTYARITSTTVDPLGCTLPSVFRVLQDWRISYVCNGAPYFTMLRADQRYIVPTQDGTTQRVIGELGIHFLVMSTTADLLEGSGSTPGNQVYLVNLFKRPAVPVPGEIKWFPSQGLPPL